MDHSNPYEMILEALDLTETELQDLKTPLVKLRQSFRRREVKNLGIYSEKLVRLAYLIAYFPAYTRLIPETLDRIGGKEIKAVNFQELSFIGSGPGPEIYGFIQYLKSKNLIKPTQMIKINRFDLKLWNKEYTKYVLPAIKDLHPCIIDQFHELDFKDKLQESVLETLTN